MSIELMFIKWKKSNLSL